MGKDIVKSHEYKKFFCKLKEEIIIARQKAYQTVNKQLVELYLHIGKDIYEKMEISNWGEGVVERLSNDLQKEFPDMKGFSSRNLWEMKKLYEIYKDNQKLQPLVAELSWSHNILILHHTESIEEKEFYIKTCIKVKIDGENPSVGLILCKSKDEEVVRIALCKSLSPMKVATYRTKIIDRKLLQRKLRSLPLPEGYVEE